MSQTMIRYPVCPVGFAEERRLTAQCRSHQSGAWLSLATTEGEAGSRGRQIYAIPEDGAGWLKVRDCTGEDLRNSHVTFIPHRLKSV